MAENLESTVQHQLAQIDRLKEENGELEQKLGDANDKLAQAVEVNTQMRDQLNKYANALNVIQSTIQMVATTQPRPPQ